MKYAEMFRFGAEALERAGVGEAELDARLLIEAVCHTSRNDLLVHGDREITEEQEQQYREWIALREIGRVLVQTCALDLKCFLRALLCKKRIMI